MISRKTSIWMEELFLNWKADYATGWIIMLMKLSKMTTREHRRDNVPKWDCYTEEQPEDQWPMLSESHQTIGYRQLSCYSHDHYIRIGDRNDHSVNSWRLRLHALSEQKKKSIYIAFDTLQLPRFHNSLSLSLSLDHKCNFVMEYHWVAYIYTSKSLLLNNRRKFEKRLIWRVASDRLIR